MQGSRNNSIKGTCSSAYCFFERRTFVPSDSLATGAARAARCQTALVVKVAECVALWSSFPRRVVMRRFVWKPSECKSPLMQDGWVGHFDDIVNLFS